MSHIEEDFLLNLQSAVFYPLFPSLKKTQKTLCTIKASCKELQIYDKNQLKKKPSVLLRSKLGKCRTLATKYLDSDLTHGFLHNSESVVLLLLSPFLHQNKQGSQIDKPEYECIDVSLLCKCWVVNLHGHAVGSMQQDSATVVGFIGGVSGVHDNHRWPV